MTVFQHWLWHMLPILSNTIHLVTTLPALFKKHRIWPEPTDTLYFTCVEEKAPFVLSFFFFFFSPTYSHWPSLRLWVSKMSRSLLRKNDVQYIQSCDEELGINICRHRLKFLQIHI